MKKASRRVEQTKGNALPSQVASPGLKHRDRSGEDQRAQLALFHNAHDLREARDNGQMSELWMVAQALILCGLPYDEVSDHLWEKRARLADGSELIVTFATSKKGVSLPFGQDRGPLYYMLDRAISQRRKIQKRIDSDASLTVSDDLGEAEKDFRLNKRAMLLDQARFVEWATANEYLDATDQQAGGRQYDTLKARMRRISLCNISIVRQKPNGTMETLLLPMIRSSRTPKWLSSKGDGTGGSELAQIDESEPVGFEIGPDFFTDVAEHHVPVPALLIHKLLRRPKILDLVIWICWRSFAARTETFIPIDDLKQQLGSSDTNDNRLLVSIRGAITFLRQAGWHELNAEVISPPLGRAKRNRATQSGLRIGPPSGNKQFNTNQAAQLVGPKRRPAFDS